MAHFYGDLQGSRGQATRLGTKQSGITGHLRGWNVGAKVDVSYNESTQEDEVRICLTSGSNNNQPSIFLGKFTKQNVGIPFIQFTMEELAEIYFAAKLKRNIILEGNYNEADTKTLADALSAIMDKAKKGNP